MPEKFCLQPHFHNIGAFWQFICSLACRLHKQIANKQEHPCKSSYRIKIRPCWLAFKSTRSYGLQKFGVSSYRIKIRPCWMAFKSTWSYGLQKFGVWLSM